MKRVNAVWVAGLLLVMHAAARGQSLVLVTDGPGTVRGTPPESVKQIRAAAQTELQKQIADVLISKSWPQNLEVLKEKFKDVPEKERVEGLLPFIAIHEPANWIPHASAAVTTWLGEMGEPAAPALRKLLQSEKAEEREAAAAALAQMGHYAQDKWPKHGVETVGKLAELLTKDKSVGVRREAARALYSFGGASKPVAEQIVAALEDPDEMVRGMALEALGETEYASDAAVAATLRELQNSGREDLGPLQRQGPAAHTALPMLLERQQDPKLAEEAERALAWIGGLGPEHRELMLKALPSGVACSAAWKIGAVTVGDAEREKARAALLAGLDHVSWWSGESYAHALGDIFKGDARMGKDLAARMAAEKPVATRIYAAAAYYRVTGEEQEAVALLAREAKGFAEGPREDEVRCAAVTLLAEFGPRGRGALPEVRERWEHVVKGKEQGDLYDRAKFGTALWKLTGRAREPMDALIKDLLGKDGAYVEWTGEALVEMSPLLTERAKEIAGNLDEPGSWGDPIRWWAARLLETIGPCEQGREALPALARRLEDASLGYNQRQAAAAIWAITREPGRVVPTLVKLLEGRDRNVYHVVRLLGAMGPAAKDAVPALRTLAGMKGWTALSTEAREAIAAIEREPVRADEAKYGVWWSDLADKDADRAVAAVWAFASAGEEGRAFLAKSAEHAVDGPIAERVQQLVRALDDERYRVRERASAELMTLLPAAEPALRKVLKGAVSDEVKLRLEALLAAAPDHELTVDATAGDIRRAYRVRQVRELVAWLGSTDRPGVEKR